jgi:PAS domain S-box-containing protein
MFRPALSPSEWKITAAALGVLAVLVALDIALGSETVLSTSFLLAAFVPVLSGVVWGTALVGGLAYAAIVASGAWNENFWETDYNVRLVIGAVAVGAALFAAIARREAQRSMRRFQLLEDVTAVADGSLPFPGTIERIADVVVPELADICMIDLTAGGRADRIGVRASGKRRAELERALAARTPSIPEDLMSEDGQAAPVFRPRHDEHVLRGLAHDEADLEFLRSLDSRSSMTVPLVSRARPLGAVTLVTTGSRPRFRREDVRFARVLVDRIALALDNAGLFSDLQSVERRMDTVMAVLDEAVVIEDRSGVFLFANETAARVFGLESADRLIGSSFSDLSQRVDFYDEGGDPLDVPRLGAAGGKPGEDGGQFVLRAFSRQTGAERWLRPRSREIAGPDRAPLWVVTVFEDVSDIKQAEFAQTMLARTGELLKSHDYTETLRGIASIAIPQLADWCSVYVAADDGSLEEVAVAHRDAERVEVARRLTADYPLHSGDDSAVAEVMRTGEPLMVESIWPLLEATARDEEHLARLRELGFGSLMVMPMRVGDEVRGTLNFINDADRRPFDEFDAELGRRVAERAAVALENARLATERAEIAETLQHGLLPAPIPEIPGWAVAALYQPAGEENEVGGDFYEVFPFEDGWIVAIGDVTGRGAGAASITAIARYTLRTAASLTGDPRTALTALNRALLARRDLSLCSAALIALPGRSEGVAEVICAGHPAPFVVDGGEVRVVPSRGPVLGAFEGASWEPAAVELGPGQMLVTYTDGVTEAEAAGERFGESRLRARLAGLVSPAATVRSVEEALESFTHGQLRDDAAIVAIMRDPDSWELRALTELDGAAARPAEA